MTQIVLGATVASVCVPKTHRRQAALVGATLGTLPDLDVLIQYTDAVSNFTKHRSFSHSIFILAPLSLVIWQLLKSFYEPVKSAPKPWFLAIFLALITHPLLDAHTAYGTQLFWPLTSPPVMWSTIFIIDPLYTLPMLVALIVMLNAPLKERSKQWLVSGIILSQLYLAWTWVAKIHLNNQVVAAFDNSNQTNAFKVFSSPTPFNSFVWRFVVLEGDTYQVGYSSIFDSKVSFKAFPIYQSSTETSNHIPAARRLDWFSQGFIKRTIEKDKLIITDLRMGFESNYVFRHSIAESINGDWHQIESERLPSQLSSEDLSVVWAQIQSRL